MPDGPDGVPRRRVIRQSGDDVPVDMRELVAEQFVVDLHGIERHVQRQRDFRDFLNEPAPLILGQVKQFDGMTLEHEDGPAREKLIVMQVGLAEIKIGDPVILAGPLSCAGFTVHSGHIRRQFVA